MTLLKDKSLGEFQNLFQCSAISCYLIFHFLNSPLPPTHTPLSTIQPLPPSLLLSQPFNLALVLNEFIPLFFFSFRTDDPSHPLLWYFFLEFKLSYTSYTVLIFLYYFYIGLTLCGTFLHCLILCRVLFTLF